MAGCYTQPVTSSGASIGQNTAFDHLRIPHCRELFGLMDQQEGDALWRYARQCQKSIVEIGTYCGYSTLYLGYGIRNRPPEFQDNVQIFTIDEHTHLSHQHTNLPEMTDRKSRGKVCTFRQVVRNCKQYGIWDLVSPIIDDSAHAWKFGVDLPCDMLLIDANHDAAMRDYRHWAPLIELGGIVAFHDYCAQFPRVITDVDQLVAAGEIEKMEITKSLFVGRILRH